MGSFLESSAQGDYLKLLSYIRKSTDAIFLVSTETNHVFFVNDKASNLLGKSEEQLINASFLSIAVSDRSKVSLFLQKVKEQKMAISDKIGLQTENGDLIQIELVASLLLTPHGEFFYVMPWKSSLHDQVLREFKKRGSSIDDTRFIGRFGFSEIDVESKSMVWSDEIYDMFDLNPEKDKPTFDTLREIVEPEDMLVLDQALELAIERGEPVDTTYRVNLPNGKQRVIRSFARIYKDEKSSRSKLIGTVHDISQRVTYEIRLEEQTQRLALINEIAMGVSSKTSVDDVIKQTVKQLYTYFPQYRVAYGFLNDEGIYKCLTSQQPEGWIDITGWESDISVAHEYMKALRKEAVIVENVSQDSRLEPIASIVEGAEIKAMLDVPVSYRDQLNGLLCLDSSEVHTWTEHEIRMMEEVARFLSIAIRDAQLLEERKETAERLRKTAEKLKEERKELKEKNITLNQILKHLEREKEDYKEEICESVELVLVPIVDKLKKGQGVLQARDINSLENFLKSVIGKEINDFRSNFLKLTPREIDICNLIAEGMSTKQISDTLQLSDYTVHKHRESIRRKLQITNKAINLSSYIRSTYLTDK